MKHGTLLVTAIIVSLTLYAQQNEKKQVYTLEQLAGSWQETGRMETMTKKQISLDPNNALYIRISKDSSVYMEGAANLPAYGNAYITHGTQLFLPGNDFKIISVSGQTLVLDDYEHKVHTFTKTNVSFPGEIKPAFCANCVVDISSSTLSKNWFAYSISGHPENAISFLVINSMNADKSFSGNISSLNQKYKNEPCTLVFSGRELHITAKSFSWNEFVYKASGDSLTIGKVKDHMYYFRKQEKPIENIRN